MVLKRTYVESGVKKVVLHYFPDASLEPMWMDAYLRKQEKSEKTIVIRKCRVPLFGNMIVAKLEMQQQFLELDCEKNVWKNMNLK